MSTVRNDNIKRVEIAKAPQNAVHKNQSHAPCRGLVLAFPILFLHFPTFDISHSIFNSLSFSFLFYSPPLFSTFPVLRKRNAITATL